MKLLPGLELGQSGVFCKRPSVYMVYREEKKQSPGMNFKERHPFKQEDETAEVPGFPLCSDYSSFQSPPDVLRGCMYAQTAEHGRTLSRNELWTYLHFTQPPRLKPKRSQMNRQL